MHRRIRNTLITAALIVAGAAVSSEAAGSADTGTDPFTHEALFKGVLFGEGEVARLAHGTDHAAPPDSSLTGEIVAAVNGTSPGSLPEFAAEVTSGDRLRIDAALTRAGHEVRAAAGRLGGGSPEGAAGSFIVTQGLIIYTDSGTYWASSSASGRLEKERLVDRIAEELKR